MKIRMTGFLCLVILAIGAGPALGHGLVGKRFFPSTLAIEDPFASDELTLPAFIIIKEPPEGDEPATVETEIEAEYSKRITPHLAVFFEGEWAHLSPDSGSDETGFGNPEVGLKYQLFENDVHETVISLALGWAIGGVGSKDVEAVSFSELNPNLTFGKGFGDLPNSLSYLKPFALTGVFGAKIPTRSSSKKVETHEGEVEIEIEQHPNKLQWGFVVEYSIPYLQSFVKDIGLPFPFNRMIPVVELALETPLDRGSAGDTTGAINPGVIWTKKSFQFALEAVIPINDRTGENIGVRGMFHLFLDDLFPKSLGRPIFGG